MPRGPFLVADLDVRGEVRLRERYRYDELEQIPGSPDLIATFAAEVWRSPKGFEVGLPGGRMRMRWAATAATCGIATLRAGQDLASLSLLASGLDPHADALTLQAFQRHLLSELRNTPYEPAFELLDLDDRPLVATINFRSPTMPEDQLPTALADRCFGAAYFRYLSLA